MTRLALTRVLLQTATESKRIHRKWTIPAANGHHHLTEQYMDRFCSLSNTALRPRAGRARYWSCHRTSHRPRLHCRTAARRNFAAGLAGRLRRLPVLALRAELQAGSAREAHQVSLWSIKASRGTVCTFGHHCDSASFLQPAMTWLPAAEQPRPACTCAAGNNCLTQSCTCNTARRTYRRPEAYGRPQSQARQEATSACVSPSA